MIKFRIVYQWTGTVWEKRAPDKYTDLYIRCYKDGLDVPELTQDMGWFGALFARVLIAQQAFIEELQTQVIELSEGGQIRSKDFASGVRGFQIKANGDAEFYNGKFKGTIEATDGFFNNITTINLKTGGTLNGIPIDGFARNHGDDYPVGTILFAQYHGSSPPSVNSTGEVSRGAGGTSYIWDGNGALLPGTWRVSGRDAVGNASYFGVLVRRVS